jgi:replicative DNA helicase
MANATERAERIPPQNTEAEMCVLGSMLLDPDDACGLAVDALKPEDFYLPSHRILFSRIAELFFEKKPADLVVLRNVLEKNGELDKIGGTEYLTSIVESVPTAANVEHYIGIVLDKSMLRRLIEATNTIQRDAYEERGEASEILEKGEQAVFQIAQERNESGGQRTIREIVETAMDKILKGTELGIMSGFGEIDNLTNGFKPGQFIVIAGRPGMGKTTFALNILRNAASRGTPSAFYSLEMSSEQIVINLLASMSKINSRKLHKGGNVFEDEEQLALTDAASALQEMPLFIDDRPGLTPLSVKARARRLKAANNIGMLAVDYMQLMESPGHSREGRQQEISYISRSLKALARELQIPIIAMCQLSRAPEGREDHRPRLSDLRESGAIEQDADIVFLLFREEYYETEIRSGMGPNAPEAQIQQRIDAVKNIAEINLAKHRNGEVSSNIRLTFRKECLLFTDRPPIDETTISRMDIAE